MNVDQIVWSDPDRVGGLSCFTGTRVPVKTLVDYLEGGDSVETFLEDFPSVSGEQARALLEMGADRAADLVREHALAA